MTPTTPIFECAWHRRYFGTTAWIDAAGLPVPAPAERPANVSHGLCQECKPLFLADCNSTQTPMLNAQHETRSR
jgi:hypothetical protein